MESFAGTVVKVKTIGQDQYSKFVDELLSKCVTPVADPFTKNTRPFFSHPAVKEHSKGRLQQLSMKNDCNGLVQLYGDVNKFFCHENHPRPL